VVCDRAVLPHSAHHIHPVSGSHPVPSFPHLALVSPGREANRKMGIPSMLPLLSSPFPHFFLSSSVLSEQEHIIYRTFKTINIYIIDGTDALMSKYDHESETLSSQGSPCHLRGATPNAPGHLASRRLAASGGVGTCVSNDLLSVRAPAPVTQYALRLATPVGRPSGGDPTYATACCAGPEFSRVASTSSTAEA
jgi:hypothetical protein